ncbi:MAG: hypothetical protein GY703_18305 [Gammaproteobacteria bacterium]|nr:hypothetical protein [Gammaproteobacteria bacterium]
MARHGKLVRYIQDRFKLDPDSAWLTSWLIEGFYEVERKDITKARWVAMIRAMNRAAELDNELALAEAGGPHSQMVIYRATNERSFVTMRNATSASWEEKWTWDGKPIYQCERSRAVLAGDTERIQVLDRQHAELRQRNQTVEEEFVNPEPTPDELREAAGQIILSILRDMPEEDEIIWMVDDEPVFKVVRITPE